MNRHVVDLHLGNRYFQSQTMLLIYHKYHLLFPGSLLTCFSLITCIQVRSQISDSLFHDRAELIELSKIKTSFNPDTSGKKYYRIIKNAISPALSMSKLLKSNKTKDSVLSNLHFITDKKSFRNKKFFQFKNAGVSYNYSFRSKLDTPYFGKNISQHLSNINSDILVAGKFPFRFGLYARRSNSPYFRDYTDVRLEFNTSEFRRLRSEQIVKYFNALVSKFGDSLLKEEIGQKLKQVSSILQYLSNPEMIKRYLQSREQIINKNELVGTREYKDSVLRSDSIFVKLYEEKQSKSKNIQTRLDSLKDEYTIAEKKMQKLQYLFKNNLFRPRGTEVILENLRASGIHDRQFEKMLHSLNSIRSFAIGKTMPDYTDLTIKNIVVNGINVEYNNANLYLAVVAGVVDFRTRDFIFTNNRLSRQYVTAGRIGWGN